MIDSIKDKVVVITGGTRGIGLAIAKKFIQSHSKVVITGTSSNSVEKALSELSSDCVKGYVVNVADNEQVQKVFNQIINDFSTIDILINNAGITRDTLLLRLDEQKWDEVLDVNLKGAFNCLKAVLRPMMKTRYGKIVNMSSVVGLMGNMGQANYSASKSGLFGLTKSAARELASRNICVNAIAPGFIQTEMTEDLSEQAKKAFLEHIPMQRAGKGEDVANLVLFLSSSFSDYITGQVINVDGGMLMY